jgi:GNAT superfamily N-acetyltransferase
LVIDRDVMSDYVSNDAYVCKVAEIGSEIAGWIVGSDNSKVLSEHGCMSGEFYFEEIVVDIPYRKKGIGSYLLRSTTLGNLKTIVVDTPRINKQAIAFYKHNGFALLHVTSEEFSRKWVRMSRIVSGGPYDSTNRRKRSFCFPLQPQGSQVSPFLYS